MLRWLEVVRTAVALCALAAPALGQDLGEVPAEAPKLRKIPGFSPYSGRNYPTRVYWGDEHVHTGWSGDAGAFGCRLGPEEAFRFARGEEIVSSTGTAARLSRPLDWMALTDHSDAAGISWTAYEVKRFKVTPPPGTQMTTQERAYTSPIWYTPAG